MNWSQLWPNYETSVITAWNTAGFLLKKKENTSDLNEYLETIKTVTFDLFFLTFVRYILIGFPTAFISAAFLLCAQHWGVGSATAEGNLNISGWYRRNWRKGRKSLSCQTLIQTCSFLRATFQHDYVLFVGFPFTSLQINLSTMSQEQHFKVSVADIPSRLHLQYLACRKLKNWPTSDGLMGIFFMVQVKCFWESVFVWNKTLGWVSKEMCTMACVL